MKKTIALVLVFALAFSLMLPTLALADGGYEYLKTLLGIQYIDSVAALGTPLDVTSSFSESEGVTGCFLDLQENNILIFGRNSANKYEAQYWRNLTFPQVRAYSVAVLTMFDSIDQARTTSNTFWAMLIYGSGDNDYLMIRDAETAKQVVDILVSD